MSIWISHIRAIYNHTGKPGEHVWYPLSLSLADTHTYRNKQHKCEAIASRYIIYTLSNSINKLEKRVLLLLPVTNKLHARIKLVSRRKLRRRRLLITSNIMLPYGRDEWISQFTIYWQPCSFFLYQVKVGEIVFFQSHCIYNSRLMTWKNTIMKWTGVTKEISKGIYLLLELKGIDSYLYIKR